MQNFGRLFVTKIYKLAIGIRNNTLFIIDYIKFNKFINKNKIHQKCQKVDSEIICITVIPWLGTSVPWYAITMALMLERKGKNVFILFVDMPFGDEGMFHRLQSYLILKILNKIPIKITKLSNYNDSEYCKDEITRLSKLNSLHYAHGETNYALRKSYEFIVEKQLKSISAKLVSFFEKENLRQIILPGGIWGPSSVISLLAEKNNVQLTTYDSGENELIMSISGIAATLSDIPYSFEQLLNNPEDKSFSIQKGQEQLQKRKQGEDLSSFAGSHLIKPTTNLKFGDQYYLILLNSVWDTAALGIHTVYGSMIEWIFDSIEWILNNTDSLIIIRQHPAERVKEIDNTDVYKEKINIRFSNNKRIIFIDAAEDINTYNLIEKSLCVLGFSSTIVVESVALGKPAIIVSSAYYSEFDIVYSATDKKEYYMYLKQALEHNLVITPEMRDRAYICNYITQSCNYYLTKFTPIRNNYIKWSKLTIDELEKDYLPLKAILKNKPISLLQHERTLNDLK